MVSIDNFEKLLEEYSSLLDFYNSELAKLPDMNLHYKKIKGKYFPYISRMIDGSQKQEALGRKNVKQIDLEEKLKYRRALVLATNILEDNLSCVESVLHGDAKQSGIKWSPFAYEIIDKMLPVGFCADGWSFAKYMRSVEMGSFGKYDAEEWFRKSKFPEYKQAVLMRDADKLRFDTSQGFRVRSKSEVLISTLVGQASLLFKYEEPIELIVHSETKRLYEKFCRNVEVGGRKIMLPDFTILAPDGKLWLWEHQGMMDDPQYREKYFFRHDIYVRNGFVVGKNLIFTFESEDEPISVEQIERVIKYILAGE